MGTSASPFPEEVVLLIPGSGRTTLIAKLLIGLVSPPHLAVADADGSGVEIYASFVVLFAPLEVRIHQFLSHLDTSYAADNGANRG